jgi:type VI secretion system protein ImpI
MALRLQIIGHHGHGLGERSTKEFGRAGGTIGRSLKSDWALPDDRRYISSRHASIEYRSGGYYILDTSTNGVYVNDAAEPLGRDQRQRLFTGDRIRVGEYEMLVEIDAASKEAYDGGFHLAGPVDAVAKAPRVPPPDAPRAELVSAHDVTDVDIAPLLDEQPEPFVRSTAKPEAKSTPRPGQPPAAKPVQPGGAASMAALEAFCRGAGLPVTKLDDKQLAETMQRLGQVMRELVVGISDNLYVRGEHKNLLRLQTTIQTQNNNPLQFPINVGDALHALLFRDSGESLTAVEAVREAFNDIKQHQQHLLAALRMAMDDYVGRLDPDEVENSSARRNGLINAANKLKYWDQYRDLYRATTQAPPGQFPQQFLDALAQAYETASARGGRAAPAAMRHDAKIG